MFDCLFLKIVFTIHRITIYGEKETPAYISQKGEMVGSLPNKVTSVNSTIKCKVLKILKYIKICVQT